MASAYIALGSNQDPETYLPEAATLMAFLFKVTGVSSFYRNPALDRPDRPEFVNGMVRVETDFPPLTIKKELLMNLEEQLDRVRTEDKNAPRTIDLDLCLYGDMLYKEGGLVLPDPELTRRPFLYIPLLDIEPDILFPGTDEKLADLVLPRAKVKGLRKDDKLSKAIKEAVNG